MSRPDRLAPVNEYERSLFLQIIKRQAKPVFGYGWAVTKDQVRAAFWTLNPDLAENEGAEVMFDMMFLEALILECEEMGYKVIQS